MANIFDIIGPIMVGPSSSHTAGAARLGMVARTLLKSTPCRAEIKLHGSFAQTYKGHGTDKAIIGGLLGFSPDDLRIKDSLRIAKNQGLTCVFSAVYLGDVHPNTAVITVFSQTGECISIQGSSIGGGKIKIHAVNDLPAEFTAESDTLIVYHIDTPGVIAAVTGLLAKHDVNIGRMKVFRSHRGGRSVIVMEIDQAVCTDLCQLIRTIPNVTEIMAVPGTARIESSP